MIEVKVFLGLHICLRLSAHLFLVFLKRVKESVLNSVLQYMLNSGEYNLYSYSYSFSFHGRNLSFILLKSLHNARNLSEIQDTVLIKIYKNVLKYFPLIPQAYILRSRSKYNFCLSVCLSLHLCCYFCDILEGFFMISKYHYFVNANVVRLMCRTWRRSERKRSCFGGGTVSQFVCI